MEIMSIRILSVEAKADHIVARAYAQASAAEIYIRVSFEDVGDDLSKWEQARDQVLRYLDPA